MTDRAMGSEGEGGPPGAARPPAEPPGGGGDRGRRAETAVFAELRRTGAVELRNRLVERYLPFARHLARRFTHKGVAVEDLEQVAGLGLVEAVDRFDPHRGVAFTTFAGPTVLGELKRSFRDGAWSLRVPRSVQERHQRVNAEINRLTQANGRSPTTAELAGAAGCNEEQLVEVLDAGASYRSASLDVGTRDGDERVTLAESLGAEGDGDVFALEDRLAVRQLLGTLPWREQLILRMRFEEDMSQRQIAARLDISQMHVSRLLARSLASLRRRMGTGPAAFAG